MCLTIHHYWHDVAIQVFTHKTKFRKRYNFTWHNMVFIAFTNFKYYWALLSNLIHKSNIFTQVIFIWIFLIWIAVCVFTFWVPCGDVSWDFHIKTKFGSYIYIQMFTGGGELMSSLRYLWGFLRLVVLFFVYITNFSGLLSFYFSFDIR